MKLDKETARQFAILRSSGIPELEVMNYFAEEGQTIADLRTQLGYWLRSKTVQDAILMIQGKPWEDMSLEEKIKNSIDKHYTEVAYFLFSHNYAELEGAGRTKADICRQVLETKLAGMSGKTDALSKFWADMASGAIKVPLSKGEGQWKI